MGDSEELKAREAFFGLGEAIMAVIKINKSYKNGILNIISLSN